MQSLSEVEIPETGVPNEHRRRTFHILTSVIQFIIWLSLFSPCDWSICGPYLTIPTKIFKENVHFGALNLFISEKRFK